MAAASEIMLTLESREFHNLEKILGNFTRQESDCYFWRRWVVGIVPAAEIRFTFVSRELHNLEEKLGGWWG